MATKAKTTKKHTPPLLGHFVQRVFIQLQRFWRLAEVRLLFLSLLVSVVAVTSVGFFTDRADRAMSAQATHLLGGDLVIDSTRPVAEEIISEAVIRGLKTAITINFPSMVSSIKAEGDTFKLAQVKAVSDQYPLYGDLEIVDNTKNANKQKSSIVAQSGLFTGLEAKVGDTVQLGQSEIVLGGVIKKMPDQATNAFQLAPVLILPMDKLAETGLLTAASRASYRYLFAGDVQKISDYKDWLKTKLKPNERLRTLDDGLPSVQQALQRGQRFLKMASLLAVILAGAGIALSSYSLTRHETPTVAVLKTMGGSRRQILTGYLGQLFLVASLAAIVGSALGYFIQNILAYYLQDFVGQTLPSAGWRPVGVGFLTAWIMAMGFSVPQLVQLTRISPIQILQGQNITAKTSKIWTFTSFLALSLATLVLMILQTQDLKLSVTLLFAVILALGLFWLIALFMQYLLRRFGQSFSLPKPNRRMTLLIVVFGIGLFSLLLLTALRGDLVNRWQASLPANAPNHFFINIQPDEVKPLKVFLQDKLSISENKAPLYPMILGRLVEINNQPVSPDDETFKNNTRAQRLLIREFNISATEVMPQGNIISSGEWFNNNDKTGLSVEEGIAETYGLKVGDSMTFDIAGQRITEAITSLRSVQWDSMKPNFFVLLAPKAIEDFPKTYITSVHIEESKLGALPQMIQQFPSVTDIDISAILTQVRELINKAAFAVQAIFVFTLVASVVVLFAALQSQKTIRRKEIAVLKTLGANRAYLRRSLLLEFAMIGGLAGFIASILAIIVANIAASALFDLSPEINLSLLFVGTLLGALLVSLAGYFNVRSLLEVVPVSLFR